MSLLQNYNLLWHIFYHFVKTKILIFLWRQQTFFLLRDSSRGGSLDISVLRSFRSAFKHWWRTFCVKTEPLILQELVFTWHAVCTARMHYCDVSFCFWCVRSVQCARRSSSMWRTLSTPTARTHCDLLCAESQPLFYILNLLLIFLSCWSRCTGGGGGGGGGGGWCCMPLHSYLGLFLRKHVCATTCKLFSLDELLNSKNTHFTKGKKKRCDLLCHNEI